MLPRTVHHPGMFYEGLFFASLERMRAKHLLIVASCPFLKQSVQLSVCVCVCVCVYLSPLQGQEYQAVSNELVKSERQLFS